LIRRHMPPPSAGLNRVVSGTGRPTLSYLLSGSNVTNISSVGQSPYQEIGRRVSSDGKHWGPVVAKWYSGGLPPSAPPPGQLLSLLPTFINHPITEGIQNRY
jgi:hypothetical protein